MQIHWRCRNTSSNLSRMAALTEIQNFWRALLKEGTVYSPPTLPTYWRWRAGAFPSCGQHPQRASANPCLPHLCQATTHLGAQVPKYLSVDDFKIQLHRCSPRNIIAAADLPPELKSANGIPVESYTIYHQTIMACRKQSCDSSHSLQPHGSILFPVLDLFDATIWGWSCINRSGGLDAQLLQG